MSVYCARCSDRVFRDDSIDVSRGRPATIVFCLPCAADLLRAALRGDEEPLQPWRQREERADAGPE